MRVVGCADLYPSPAPRAEWGPAVATPGRADRLRTASWWSPGWILIGAALGFSGPALGAGADPTRGAALFQAECANCHGPDAAGGRAGEYPRLAGLPAGYLKLQLESFRDRKRQNKPMIPIFKAGRLRGDDIAAVAAYLATLPSPDPARVGVKERSDYDFELGQRLYEGGCARCHGQDGNGEPNTENPPVTRQYPAYLVKQLRDFRAGARRHEDSETLFRGLEAGDLDALIGYMLDLNHAAPESPPP